MTKPSAYWKLLEMQLESLILTLSADRIMQRSGKLKVHIANTCQLRDSLEKGMSRKAFYLVQYPVLHTLFAHYTTPPTIPLQHLHCYPKWWVSFANMLIYSTSNNSMCIGTICIYVLKQFLVQNRTPSLPSPTHRPTFKMHSVDFQSAVSCKSPLGGGFYEAFIAPYSLVQVKHC